MFSSGTGSALAAVAARDAATGRGDWGAYDDAAAADPPAPVTFADTTIVVGGQSLSVTVLSHRRYQAVAIRADGVAVTVATCHCPAVQLSLEPVPVIDPYLDGYRAFLYRVARCGNVSA